MEELMTCITAKLIEEIKARILIEVEASGRHIHLSEADMIQLYGPNYSLTKVKDLSQPGQFVCKERLSVVGEKGTIHNVVVLGPQREETQLEISLTDAMVLGVKNPPIRLSGDITHSPGIKIKNGDREITISQGLIVAKRHIHMTPEDALKFGVIDGEIVKVKIFGSRPLIFDDTVIRVSPKFKTVVHIDYDEANACGYHNGVFGCILK